MKAEYRRDLQNNYLILQLPREAQDDSYKIQMAEKNEIPGLLPFHSSRKDGELYLHYEITSKQPLASVYEKRALKYQDILSLLGGISDILEALQRYLLDPGQLVFDPEFIYTEPEKRRIWLCYLPGKQNEFPITVLGEFILKKLDHEDRQAVVLGYSFYQNASEENFSLQKLLKEILAEIREEERETEKAVRAGGTFFTEGTPKTGDPAEKALSKNGDVYSGQDKTPPGKSRRFADETEEYGVVHCERRKAKKAKITERLFQVIHPAVLLSALFLMAALEIIFYFGLVNVTEAGGMFFLMISVETLINTYWKSSKKKKADEWTEETEDEMYRILQAEMYEDNKTRCEQEPAVEETRCLMRTAAGEGMRLICISGSPERFPDICIREEAVCVGKIKGESDMLLDSPTVSRVHARLECRDGNYYVKDMNSKNGTFCNGQRLEPQEQREIHAGDRIAFAEIEYRAVQMN